MNWFKKLLSGSPKDKRPEPRLLRDVQPGEYVVVEWHRIKGRIGPLKCLSNDPDNNVILLQAKWNNYKESGVPQYEKIIFNYKSDELKNFTLLNQHELDDNTDDEDIEELEKKLHEAVEQQNYIYAAELRNKINKLKNQI